MLKQSIKASLYLSCSESPLVFDDAEKEGAGTAAYRQVMDGQNVCIVDYDSKDYFVNKDCICVAEIEKSTEEVAVTDDVCPTEDESE